MFYVVYLGHVFLKYSIVICYNMNKLTYLLTQLLSGTTITKIITWNQCYLILDRLTTVLTTQYKKNHVILRMPVTNSGTTCQLHHILRTPLPNP